MGNFIQSIWSNKGLRNKILFTLALLLVYKIVAHVPVPGTNYAVLKSLMQRSEALGAFSALMGGNLNNFSILLMGLSPYINASIIVQLLTVIIPQLENLSKDGQRGYKTINKYTRWLTAVLAPLQSVGMIFLLNSLNGGAGMPVVDTSSTLTLVTAMLTVSAGTIFLMWLGELITEKGIGNGISLIIFVSIVSSMPQLVAQTLSLATEDESRIFSVIVLLVITVLLIAFVVWFTEAQRKIPVTYAGHGAKGSDKSSLPLRVNQAGMVPIIFAVSIVTFPSIAAKLMELSRNQTIKNIGEWIIKYFNPQNPNIYYISLYFLFVIFFTFFYVSIVFQPDKMAENLQKRGGFIPGIRPGNDTAIYISQVSNRLNLWGGLFIGFIAVFPYLFEFLIKGQGAGGGGSVPLLLSGAGVIIVVGVVLELFRKINVELVTQDYDKFY